MASESDTAELLALRSTLLRLARGGKARVDWIRSGERLGRLAVPLYLEYLASAERIEDAGEATLLRYTLTRMILDRSRNPLEARELFLVYQAMLGRTEQSATRCLAKCVQALQRMRRAVTEPVFHELDVETWLLARWDAALERNDHDDLWDQTGIWLCGPEQAGAAKLADALMLSPEGERWVRVLGMLEERLDDLRRAVKLRADLLAWGAERSRLFFEQTWRQKRSPVLASLFGVPYVPRA